MSDAALAFLSFAAEITLLGVLLYWAVDCSVTKRLPWDDTYFSKTIRLNNRKRDWDGD